MRLTALGIAVAVLALLALLVWGMGRRTATVGAVATPLRAAPEFSLPLYDLGHFALSEVRGHPVVVNFWASWCIPCEDEAPVLEAAARAYDGRVRFVGLDVQDTEQEGRRFIQRFGVTYPNGLDRTGAISIDYGMTGVPETFFIRTDGLIQRKWAGPVRPDQLEQFIQELLS